MNVVDSSGWLEFFADGPNAAFFSAAVSDTDQLVVPTISLLEVFKRVLRRRAIRAPRLSLNQLRAFAAFSGDPSSPASSPRLLPGITLSWTSAHGRSRPGDPPRGDSPSR